MVSEINSLWSYGYIRVRNIVRHMNLDILLKNIQTCVYIIDGYQTNDCKY